MRTTPLTPVPYAKKTEPTRHVYAGHVYVNKDCTAPLPRRPRPWSRPATPSPCTARATGTRCARTCCASAAAPLREQQVRLLPQADRQGVEGLGIRFVEVALRCMTNVLIETTMIFEDAQKEVHRVSVTDLESNVTYPLDVKVSKTVERSKPADDGSYIAMRKNSYGKPVYTVPAKDDDLLNKRAALISKAIRTLGLRIVPGDSATRPRRSSSRSAWTRPRATRTRSASASSTPSAAWA
jgi:hypothetical protein